MINVYKASAGSGKTFRLTKNYISLLLSNEDRYAYRHILAVTFTNKATAEMKSRILKELHILATDTTGSNYYSDFVPIYFADENLLRERAKRILVDILHDYSAFSISTIDKFFQQALKAFSREIGQFASYQVELDKKSLVHESVDRILDNLSKDDRDMVSWLNDSAMEHIKEGKKVNISNILYEFAERLKSEEQRELAEAMDFKPSEAFSRPALLKLRNECNEIIRSFTERLNLSALAVCDVLDEAGVDPNDSFRHFMCKVKTYRDKPEKKMYVMPGKSFFENAADEDKWFSKSRSKDLLPMVRGRLNQPLDYFCSMFGMPYKIYCTAHRLKENILLLGLACQFYSEFDALLKEKNVLGLDDSNTILRSIIDGSDAPFVYEKLGVRYEHFLLDEFQDTSTIQWQNFFPLLKESDSFGRDNLIVGDVKQSIYRWRGSDWKLLNSGIASQFDNTNIESLRENWRSAENIVSFNNAFFSHIASILGEDKGIYDDVGQVSKSNDEQKGYVRMTFCPVENELDTVVKTIEEVTSAGAAYSDIAILVRNNKEGSLTASALISANIPVISDDSLFIKSSLTVRRLVSLLSCVDNPQDKINTYLASSLGVEIPSDFRSLVDLCHNLLRLLQKHDAVSFQAEQLYIQSFLDVLQDWTSANGNNLSSFLKQWGEMSPYLSSPQGHDSVRVLTVHKSKGLEFPIVIFPFADNVGMYKHGWHWCTLMPGTDAFVSAGKCMFPVDLSKDAENTLFSDSYECEKRLQKIDNINTFYVALTRACNALYIISKTVPKKTIVLDSCTDFSQLLYVWQLSSNFMTRLPDVEAEVFEFGQKYDFSLKERSKKSLDEEFSNLWESFPIAGRLKIASDASDFFGDDGLTGTQASHRINGIVLHEILSSVTKPSDLQAAVDYAVCQGKITMEEGREDYELLQKRILAAQGRGWFPESGALNEVSVFDVDGTVHRPDRVVILPDRTIIIDYKFGEPEPFYKKQVSTYMDLYKQMGYKNVSGCLWFVLTDEVVEV